MKAVLHLILAALAIVITRGFALVFVSVLVPVHAYWEDESRLVLVISISALGAAFFTFVERLSCKGSDLQRTLYAAGRLIEIAEGLVGKGAGQQAGSNERLQHHIFIITNSSLTHALDKATIIQLDFIKFE